MHGSYGCIQIYFPRYHVAHGYLDKNLPRPGNLRSKQARVRHQTAADVAEIRCFGEKKRMVPNRQAKTLEYMGVSKNSGTQQPWVFLLKMIILGCFGGTTI